MRAFKLLVVYLSLFCLVEAHGEHYLKPGECASYVRQRFNAVSAKPMNWPPYGCWVAWAKYYGWKTSTNHWDAKPGAIMVWRGTQGNVGHVAFVEKVTGERVDIAEMNGYPGEAGVVRRRVLNVANGFERYGLQFVGFVYPKE